MKLINTTENDITVTGRVIPANGELVIDQGNRPSLANSDLLMTEIGNGNVIVNDGLVNLGISDGIDYLKSGITRQVELSTQTPMGINKIAVVKPDGNSSTLISHNFCDSSSWENSSDSEWSFAPESGERLKVLKAEVQFSHDIEMKTQTTPGELTLQVFAGGSAVDTRVFKSLADVFDLGNKHYSMNESVDGIPGMTTVVFDYADSIVLYSSLGMEIKLSLKNHAPLGGTHCSISFVVDPS